MVSQKEIDRINFLANKAKKEELTPEEKDEQKKLRNAYISAFKANLRSQLEMIEVVDE